MLQSYVGTDIDKGTLRELFFLQALRDANYKVFYSKQDDYQVIDHVFEIGGKSKTGKQMAESKFPGIIVRDDVLAPGQNVIPFILFWIFILIFV